VLSYCRDVVDIRAADAQCGADAVLDVRLDAPNARAPEVLALDQVWRRNCHVGDGILDAIVEPGRAPRDVAGRDHVDADLSAHQALRAKRWVRERDDRSLREATVELVERRRAK